MALVTVVKCGDDMRKASEMRSFTEKKTEKISLSLKYGNYIQACVNMLICLGSQPITMHNYHPGITMEIGLRLWFNKHFWFANAINLCTNASAPHQHQPPSPKPRSQGWSISPRHFSKHALLDHNDHSDERWREVSIRRAAHGSEAALTPIPQWVKGTSKNKNGGQKNPPKCN
jgi:hypothetical protein